MKLHKATHTAYKTKILYCLYNSTSKKDFSNQDSKLSKNKILENKEILY